MICAGASRASSRATSPGAARGRARQPGLWQDPHWRDLVLFHECFDGDTGRGIGASHQTGWTALITRCLIDLARTPPAT